LKRKSLRHCDQIETHKIRSKLSNEQSVPYILSSPLLVALAIFFLYPLIYAIASSLFVNRSFTPAANYSRLVADSFFWHSLLVTLLYVVIYTVGIMVIGFVIALAVDTSEQWNLRGSKITTSVLTLPYAIPDVVAVLVWLWILNPRRGVMNYLLSLLGHSGFGWLTDSSIALLIGTMVEIWRLFPMHSLIILAAFKTVPTSLFEAAELDGASTITKFFHITLPSVSNIMSFLILLTIVWSFKRFTMMWLLTGGGPMRATEILSIKIFKEAFMNFDRNYAAAHAVALFVIVLVVSLLYLKRRSHASE
jgi:multiple sugar transport system permease protein